MTSFSRHKWMEIIQYYESLLRQEKKQQSNISKCLMYHTNASMEHIFPMYIIWAHIAYMCIYYNNISCGVRQLDIVRLPTVAFSHVVCLGHLISRNCVWLSTVRTLNKVKSDSVLQIIIYQFMKYLNATSWVILLLLFSLYYLLL